MSSFVCGNRRAADQYSSAKSMGQFILAASLIIDDIKDLYDAFGDGRRDVKYFWALVIIISISLLFQVIAMIFATILYTSRYPRHTQDPNRERAVELSPVTMPESTTGSTDTLGIEFSREPTDTLVDPIPPIALRRLNDALTVLAVLCAVFHVMKTGLQSEMLGGGMTNNVTPPPSPL